MRRHSRDRFVPLAIQWTVVVAACSVIVGLSYTGFSGLIWLLSGLLVAGAVWFAVKAMRAPREERLQKLLFPGLIVVLLVVIFVSEELEFPLMVAAVVLFLAVDLALSRRSRRA